MQGGGGIQDIWIVFIAGSAANLLCDFEQVIFFSLCYLIFCKVGRAHLVSHGALGRWRDFLGDHDQDAAVAKLADLYVPGSAACVIEGARGERAL